MHDPSGCGPHTSPLLQPSLLLGASLALQCGCSHAAGCGRSTRLFVEMLSVPFMERSVSLGFLVVTMDQCGLASVACLQSWLHGCPAGHSLYLFAASGVPLSRMKHGHAAMV